MYKLISITDKQGVEKVEFMNELKANHPNMMGELEIKEMIDEVFLFYWDDDSGKMLKSSEIEKYEEIDGEECRITTMNNIYEFVRVEE